MADLGSFKEKNAARLRKAERLKRAQSVRLADPMVGYQASAGGPPAPDQPEVSGSPAPAPKSASAPVPKTPASKYGPAPIPATTSPAREPAVGTSRHVKGRAEPAPSGSLATLVDASATPRPGGKDAKLGDSAGIRFTFQFREGTYPRVEAAAKTLGIKPLAILVKAAKMTAPEERDFTEVEDAPRIGPTYRHAVPISEARAAAWIAVMDPLGIVERPGLLLRAVALNAFDRATDILLKQIEGKEIR